MGIEWIKAEVAHIEDVNTVEIASTLEKPTGHRFPGNVGSNSATASFESRTKFNKAFPAT